MSQDSERRLNESQNVSDEVKKPTPWGFTFLGTVLVLAFITVLVMGIIKLGLIWFA